MKPDTFQLGSHFSLSVWEHRPQAWDSERTLESLPRPAASQALRRVLGRQPGTSPTRAEHRVSAEHVAEAVNKGGGWQARAGGALGAMGWKLPCPQQPLSEPGPRRLTLPHLVCFLDGCQREERSLRPDCAVIATAEAKPCHLARNTFPKLGLCPCPGTLCVSCLSVYLPVCLSVGLSVWKSSK